MLIGDWNVALNLVSMPLLSILSKKSNFWSRFYIWAWINGYRLCQKYQINTSLLQTITRANCLSMAYGYSRWAVWFKMSSNRYSASYLVLCQKLSTKFLKLLRLLYNKILNFSQKRELKLLLSNLHFCCC